MWENVDFNVWRSKPLEDLLWQSLLTILKSSIPIALDTETTDLNPFKAELVGIGICWGEKLNELAYIPIGHKIGDPIFNNKIF